MSSMISSHKYFKDSLKTKALSKKQIKNKLLIAQVDSNSNYNQKQTSHHNQFAQIPSSIIKNTSSFHSQSSSNLSQYLQITSPIKNLTNIKAQQNDLKNHKNDFMMKLNAIKNMQLKKKNKYAAKFNDSIQYTDTELSENKQKQNKFIKIKASSVFYHLPQFSPPQINFQIASQIQKKMSEMQNQIGQHLPSISVHKSRHTHLNSCSSLNRSNIQSSNYYTKSEIQSHFKNRTKIIQLQQWLKDNLKNPPKNHQACIDYKNMIMGVGMKQLIRIISKRCHQEGKLIQQVWQATWAICRQIILFLSQRSHQCQKILQQQIEYIKISFGKQMDKLYHQNVQFKQKIQTLQENYEKISLQQSQLKKKFKDLKLKYQKLQSESKDYGQQFTKVLQQNLGLYLQMGNRQKREWVKKVYKQLSEMKNKANAKIMKQHTKQALDNRINFQICLQTQKGFDKQVQINIQDIEKQIKEQMQIQNKINEQQKLQSKHDLKKLMKSQFSLQQTECQTDQIKKQQIGISTQLYYSQKQTFFQHNLIQGFYVDSQVNTDLNGKVIQNKKAISYKKQAKETPNKMNKTNSSIKKTYKHQQPIVNMEKSFKKILYDTERMQVAQKGIQVNGTSILRDLKAFQDCQCGKKIEISIINDEVFINGTRKVIQLDHISSSLEFNIIKDSNIKYQNKFQIKKSHHSRNKSQEDYNLDRDQMLNYDKSNFTGQNQDIHSEQQLNIGKKNYKDGIRYSKNNIKIDLSNRNNKNKARISQKSSLLNDIQYKNILENKEKLKNRISEQHQNNIIDQIQEEQLKQLEKYESKSNNYYKRFSKMLLQNNQQFYKKLSLPSYNNDTLIDQYFQIVKQALHSYPLNHSEKHMTILIQKAVYPILSDLLKTVKKSNKSNTLNILVQHFPSLPNIMMTNFSRKYGVKSIARKNMKIFLQYLKQIRKYTNKFSLIQLLMFTDCKKSTSQDLFVYLLLIGVLDYNFTNRVLNQQQILIVKQISQQYLGENQLIYKKLEQIRKGIIESTKSSSNNTPQNTTLKLESNNLINQESFKFMNIIKSVVTGYRIYKLQRIEELGFIFLMLKNKQRQFMFFKRFIYFLVSLNLDSDQELLIAKKFLQSCDFKNKHQEIIISQSGFTHFLLSCPQFNMKLLEKRIENQKIKTMIQNNYQTQKQQTFQQINIKQQNQQKLDIEINNQNSVQKQQPIVNTKQNQIQNDIQNKLLSNSLIKQNEKTQKLEQNQRNSNLIRNSFEQENINSSKQTNKQIKNVNQIVSCLKKLNQYNESIIDFIDINKDQKLSQRGYQIEVYNKQLLSYRSSAQNKQIKLQLLSEKQINWIIQYLINNNLQKELDQTIGLINYFSIKQTKMQIRKIQQFILQTKIQNSLKNKQEMSPQDKFHAFLEKQGKYL